MAILKTKTIGSYQINKYPKVVWVSKLPFMEQVKKFKTFSQAEKWVKNKVKK
ncbi:MAG: hypothetical protein ACOCV1_06790 [Bacillota bacterium]